MGELPQAASLLAAAMVLLAMAYAKHMLLNLELRRTKAILALTPIMPLFLCLPWLPQSCNVRTALAIPLLWIAPSKLSLLAFNTPLDARPWLSSGLMPFCASTLLPVRVTAAAPSLSASRIAIHGVLLKLILLIGILNVYPLFPAMALPLRYSFYCIHFYLGLELAFFVVSKSVEILFGVAMGAPFDQPYLAETLSEFWGRRWNLAVHDMLKATVYRPLLAFMGRSVAEVSGGQSGSGRALRMAAAAATFAMSGAVHELIFVYVARGWATGEMTAFFLLHGLATIGEAACMPAYRRLPRLMRHLLTLSFLYVTASLFFMKPLRRAGVDEESIAEYHRLQSAFVSLVGARLRTPGEVAG